MSKRLSKEREQEIRNSFHERSLATDELLVEIDALRAESLANSKHIEKLHKELAHQITKYEHDMERGVGAFENEYMKRVAAEKKLEEVKTKLWEEVKYQAEQVLEAKKERDPFRGKSDK